MLGSLRVWNRVCALGPLSAFMIWDGSRIARAALPTKPVLTLQEAMRVVQAAMQEAGRIGHPAAIAVVDDEGLLIVEMRMDHSPMLASVDLAPGKARTAALFAKPSADVEKSINDGRYAAITARGFVELAGGIPLKSGGALIGAIGVSTDVPEHDMDIARAGASIFP